MLLETLLEKLRAEFLMESSGVSSITFCKRRRTPF
jgi:hypothetical protein